MDDLYIERGSLVHTGMYKTTALYVEIKLLIIAQETMAQKSPIA